MAALGRSGQETHTSGCTALLREPSLVWGEKTRRTRGPGQAGLPFPQLQPRCPGAPRPPGSPTVLPPRHQTRTGQMSPGRTFILERSVPTAPRGHGWAVATLSLGRGHSWTQRAPGEQGWAPSLGSQSRVLGALGGSGRGVGVAAGTEPWEQLLCGAGKWGRPGWGWGSCEEPNGSWLGLLQGFLFFLC